MGKIPLYQLNNGSYVSPKGKNLRLSRVSLMPRRWHPYGIAIRINPKYAEAHCNLGFVLRRQGEFVDSLHILQRGHALGRQRRVWRYPSEKWVREAERFVKLDQLLPEVLAGKRKPANAQEWREYTQVCRYKQLYAAAARLSAKTYSLDVKSIPRYHAARYTVLAASGKGKDADKVDAQERVHLRQQALHWLRADLTVWTARLKAGKTTKAEIQTIMQDWQNDKLLAGIRAAKALAKLSKEQQKACRQLWIDVAALRMRAEKGK